ncbi:MAG: SdrD B-like domain-containing protein, partial [Acidimicrobiia bacterium]
MFEDTVGDGLADGAVGDANNPGRAGVDVALFAEASVAQTVDSPGEVGQYSSIAIGSDGNPVVSYANSISGDLKVLHCDDAACSSYSVNTVEAAGSVGQHTSLAIGADGFPVISHYDWGNYDLRVYKCTSLDCTTGSGTIVDSAGTVGQYSSIAIGTDGLPIISYYEGTNRDLKVAHCTDAACTTSTRTTIDSFSTVGVATSIAIGADGLAVISYRYVPGADLKVAHCSNVACTAATTTTVDTPNDLAVTSWIAQGSDGLPVVAYQDLTNADLKIAHCTNATCTARTITTVDGPDQVGYSASVAIGTDGFPIVAYYDATNQDLKVADCGSLDCSTVSFSSPDTVGNVGIDPSIVIGLDGSPVIAYRDEGSRDLKIFVAGNGLPDASDTFISTTTTDGAGAYNFTSVADGTYWVAAESSGVSAGAGYNGPTYTQAGSWAEQTYGASGAQCANGSGGTTALAAAGSCYGGRLGATADAFDSGTPDLSQAEHVTRVNITGGSVTDVDFGFSFNAVTNHDAATTPATNGRSAQGSLDQFLRNANAVVGANAMRFVPAVPTNASGGGGNWWQVDFGPSVDPLEAVHDADTTIDGRAYALADGTTAIDPNSGFLGANAGGGVNVGVDALPLAQVPRPELDVRGEGLVAGDGAGLTPDRLKIYRLSLSEMTGRMLEVTGPAGRVDAVHIEQNVLGTGPDAFSGSLPSGITDGVLLINTSNAVIESNLIGFTEERALGADNAVNLVVRLNELRTTGSDGTDVYGGTDGFTYDRNLIAGSDDYGIEAIGTNGTIVNNTVDNHGDGAGQSGGLRIFFDGHTIDRNIFSNNGGPGLIAAGENTDRSRTAAEAVITGNEFSGNGGLAIDLQVASTDNSLNGDGITANDGGGLIATHGNREIDFPVISGASLSGGTTTVTGTACSGCTVEIFEAVGGTGDDDPPGSGTNYHGEGVSYLESGVATGGAFSIDVTGLIAGDDVSATATDTGLGVTSEFGLNEAVVNAPTTASIAGLLWQDSNQDSIPDAGENVWLSGVTMNLYSPGPDTILGTLDDVLADTTTTSGVGTYSFTSLAAGSYLVEVDETTIPANYRLTSFANPSTVALSVAEAHTGEDF